MNKDGEKVMNMVKGNMDYKESKQDKEGKERE